VVAGATNQKTNAILVTLLCPRRSDKRSAIRHSKIPYQLLSIFYVVEWLESARSGRL